MLVQLPGKSGIENIAALFESFETIGIQNFRPEIAVIACRIGIPKRYVGNAACGDA